MPGSTLTALPTIVFPLPLTVTRRSVRSTLAVEYWFTSLPVCSIVRATITTTARTATANTTHRIQRRRFLGAPSALT